MSMIATSCVVRHFGIFLTEVDGMDEIQKVINLQGLFKKKVRGTKIKNTRTYRNLLHI